MDVRALAVSDAYEFSPVIHDDDRGSFLEWYNVERFSDHVGVAFDLRQANLSVSRRGVLRGIHYSVGVPGQAKYVTVASGSIIDFIIDLRLGSPTFGLWESVVLDDLDHRAVYLGAGLGHAFLATSESATVCYLASEVFTPSVELSIDPRDPDVGLPLQSELQLSPRDAEAPSLADRIASGDLPRWSPVDNGGSR